MRFVEAFVSGEKTGRTHPLTDLFFCAAEAAAAAAAAISARGGALNAVRSLGSSTSGLGDTLALAAAMQAASVHEEKDHYEVDDTNDEVKESISDIDAFERRLESGDARDMVMKAAPKEARRAPPGPRVSAAKPASAPRKAMKSGHEYIRSAKKAATRRDSGEDDAEDDGKADAAAQSRSDLDKFDQRFGGDDYDSS